MCVTTYIHCFIYRTYIDKGKKIIITKELYKKKIIFFCYSFSLKSCYNDVKVVIMTIKQLKIFNVYIRILMSHIVDSSLSD